MMMLVTVVLLMAAMLVVTAGGAQGLGPTGGTVTVDRTDSGVAVDPTVCTVLADGSGLFAWRPGGVCWFTPPAL